MNWPLTWLFILVVAWFLIEAFCHPKKMYEFPCLAGVMTLGFILPQLPAAANDIFLPEGAYSSTMLMGILCLLMLRLGWTLGKPVASFKIAFSEKKLLYVAACFSMAGAYFYFLLSRVPGELLIGVQVTGAPVIYLFFARFLTYGLGIALLCFAHRASVFSTAIIGFDLIFYLDRIIVSGSRAGAIELVMMVLLALWFHRGWIIPRGIMIAGIVAGTFFMASMGDYRMVTRSHSAFVLDEILEIDFAQNFEETLSKGGEEIRNATLRIDDVNRRLVFDYGKFHWNKIVFNFVPAQIFGSAFKQSLELETPALARDYNPSTGTTETGFSDAFASFWYFGAVKFLILAWFMRSIWETANSGAMLGQLLYIMSIIPAMHAISHQTDWVVPVWIHMAIFLGPVLYFCRIRMLNPLGQPQQSSFGVGYQLD